MLLIKEVACKKGLRGIRTPVHRIKTDCDNHYTIRPLNNIYIYIYYIFKCFNLIFNLIINLIINLKIIF